MTPTSDIYAVINGQLFTRHCTLLHLLKCVEYSMLIAYLQLTRELMHRHKQAYGHSSLLKSIPNLRFAITP